MSLITLVIILAVIALLFKLIPDMDSRLKILFIVVAGAAVVFWLLGFVPHGYYHSHVWWAD